MVDIRVSLGGEQMVNELSVLTIYHIVNCWLC